MQVDVDQRRFARGLDLLGIFVPQFIELEGTTFGDRQRLREQGSGIQLLEALQRPQTALAVGKQGVSHRMQRCVQTNRRQHILQGAAAAPMHVHIARSDSRKIQCLAQGLEEFQTPRVETTGQQFHADP